jgi:hypothetical protein
MGVGELLFGELLFFALLDIAYFLFQQFSQKQFLVTTFFSNKRSKLEEQKRKQLLHPREEVVNE